MNQNHRLATGFARNHHLLKRCYLSIYGIGKARR